jgi:hypothetical protein
VDGFFICQNQSQNMRRHRQKTLRYGLASALFAFLAGLAITAFLVPETPFRNAPRWKGVLWVYLGAHSVELSTVHTGGAGLETVQPLDITQTPALISAVPPVTAAAASFYTCSQVSTTRIKQNLSNAVSAGMGYFLIALLAILVSDARPGVSLIIGIALLIAAGLWLGSSFISAFSGGMPFISIASFGTVAALGVLLLMGGIAIVSAIWGVVAVSFGAAAVVGVGVGANRHMKKLGDRQGADFSRLHGIRIWLKENWLETIIVIAVLTALFVGLSGEQLPVGSV